jgi:histone acetyltransferase (RNA polymerase elongator complex component)
MSGKRVRQYANIPIFIPHLGCPNTCVFCNQHTISGHVSFDLTTVREEIEAALSTLGECTHCEIAFFGGSFTGIDRSLMIDLLDIAQEYVCGGRVHAIRLSTRPDYVNDEILSILSQYAVQTVELGLQSMNDHVLDVARRGHDSETAKLACRMVKKYGFRLVGQMMIGLPGAEGADECETARQIAALGADAARVYPMVVFRETELCAMAQRGEYRILPQEEMLSRTADVLEILNAAHIPVIRVGLCASENLTDPQAVFGGANESALGELAEGELFYRRMRECLQIASSNDIKKEIIFGVPKGCISKAVGQKRKNAERLCLEFGIGRIRFQELSRLSGYQIELL